MSGINELLKEGIISKLREYDAYIDNELPDYIMVMLANNKTITQISNDLQLFLSGNTDKFTSWLQEAITNPDILRNKGDPVEMADPHPTASRKRKKSRSEEPPPPVQPRPQEQEEEGLAPYEEEEEGEEDEGPPVVKVSKMRSDRYSEEKLSRTRSERPSLRRYDVHAARANAKKTVRAQPDSTRDRERDRERYQDSRYRSRDRDRSQDRDLRELIGSSHRQRSSSGRGSQQLEWVRKRRGREEEWEGQPDEEEEGQVEGEEVEIAVPTTTMSSVVKLVERPKRTDAGGSRLLHRAILGLAPSSKRSRTVPIAMEGGVVRRSSEGEKVIILPASVLREGGRKKIVLTKMQPKIAQDSSSPSPEVEGQAELEEEDEEEEVVTDEEGEEEEDEDDEVIVNVAGGGQEFEDEYRLEEGAQELSAVSGMKRRGSKIAVLTSSGGRTRGGGREEEVDLRDIITLSRQGKKERVSNPRFVVTLSGVPDNIEQAESLSKQPYSPITSPTTLTQSTTSESLTRKSIKDRLGVKQVQEAESVEEIVKEEEEDYGAQGGGLPERCRFWPNCKNGDSCPYHHPTVPCKLFPDCKYGKKCLYVHPQCKFNARCTRADCPYLHTAPRHLATAKTQVMPQVIPTPIPVPQMFRPSFSPYSYSGGPRLRPRYPNKSAFTWKPSGHISERRFAVPDDQTTNLS